MIKRTIILVMSIIFGCILILACKKQTNVATEQNTIQIKNEKLMENVLSEVEKKEGWQLLFDGKSLDGWHKYGTDSIGKAWIIDDQSIHLNVSDKKEWQAKNGGDIISKDEFSNFHLKLDWKITKNGNSGIIFYVHEDSNLFKYPWMTGPEMQVLDNNGHPDAKIIKHKAGDLYDLITSKEMVKPAYEWNHAEIIASNGKLEFYLNDAKVLETTMWNEEWKKMIAKSKFNEFPGFGTYKTGKLCLQDHGDKVWFRNIKIMQLK